MDGGLGVPEDDGMGVVMGDSPGLRDVGVSGDDVGAGRSVIEDNLLRVATWLLTAAEKGGSECVCVCVFWGKLAAFAWRWLPCTVTTTDALVLRI